MTKSNKQQQSRDKELVAFGNRFLQEYSGAAAASNAQSSGMEKGRSYALGPGGLIELIPKEGRAPLLHTYAHARAREIMTFFAFEQQQMGNWPINCCNDLGLPIRARSSTIPEPVQARTAPDVVSEPSERLPFGLCDSRSYPTNK
jgi:hypothetical protein